MQPFHPEKRAAAKTISASVPKWNLAKVGKRPEHDVTRAANPLSSWK